MRHADLEMSRHRVVLASAATTLVYVRHSSSSITLSFLLWLDGTVKVDTAASFVRDRIVLGGASWRSVKIVVEHVSILSRA